MRKITTGLLLLVLATVAGLQAQNPFKPIPLPQSNSPISSTFLGTGGPSDTLYWTKTWDYGGLIGDEFTVSGGGVIPDSSMIAWIETASPRTPGRAYIHSQMGVPFYKASTDSTYFVFPGQTDTVGINSGANGFFRLHHSLLYELNLSGNRSTNYRGFSDTTLGRTGGIRNDNNSRIEHIVDPFLQPTSNMGRVFSDGAGGTITAPSTKLDGSPLPNVRWNLFSMRPIYDDESISFDWPGQDQGDYTNTSTDGPHYALNIWQMKGKFSGVVTMNLKWQGERLTLIIQSSDELGNVTVYRYVLIGPNSDTGYDELFSTYANDWLDFAVRAKPGFTSQGDNPGLDFWFKRADSTNWRKLVTFSGNIVSEVEADGIDIQMERGIPYYYLGLSNGGIYPSTRFSGFALISRWTPFRLANPTRGFIKIDHGEYYYAEYPEGLEPDTTTMLAFAHAALSGEEVVVSNDTLPVDSFVLSVTPYADSAVFSWPDIIGGDRYQLRVIDGSGTVFNGAAGTVTSPTTVTGLEIDSAHTAWARVYPGADPQDTIDIGGNFAQTPTINFRTLEVDNTPPGLVNILFTFTTNTTAEIVWNAVDDSDPLVYNLTELIGDGVGTAAAARQTSDTTTFYTGLTPGVEYYTTIEAFDPSGNASGLSVIVFTTQNNAPGSFAIDSVQADTTSAQVFWSNASGAESYTIRALYLGGGTHQNVATVTSPHTITGLVPDSAYEVWVRAINPAGTSQTSTVQFRTASLPSDLPPSDTADLYFILFVNGKWAGRYEIGKDVVYKTIQIDAHASDTEYPQPNTAVELGNNAATRVKKIQILTPNQQP